MINQVYNNSGDNMKSYKGVIELYFKSIRGFTEFESRPRDFGTGDLLYSSEIHTLCMIGENANINLTELAEKLGISKSGVSKFIKKILKKGLITKGKQGDNKKEVVFNLTEKGLIAYWGHKKFDEEVFASIHETLASFDDQQVEFLESFLSKLTSEIEKLNK